jgi:uncharacterized membrane protein
VTSAGRQEESMQGEDRIVVKAPISVVWGLLTDINQWPRWQKAVSKAHSPGPLADGQTFTWTSGGMPIRSTVVSHEPPHAIQWTGETIGTKARHDWQLAEAPEGTIVETSESMSGWLVSIMGLFKPNFLNEALGQTLADLKHEAELGQAV